MLVFKSKYNSLPGYDLFAKKRDITQTEKRNQDLEGRHLSVVTEKGDQSDMEEKRRHQIATLVSNPEHLVRGRRNKRNHISYGTEYTASDNKINIEVDRYRPDVKKKIKALKSGLQWDP